MTGFLSYRLKAFVQQAVLPRRRMRRRLAQLAAVPRVRQTFLLDRKGGNWRGDKRAQARQRRSS